MPEEVYGSAPSPAGAGTVTAPGAGGVAGQTAVFSGATTIVGGAPMARAFRAGGTFYYHSPAFALANTVLVQNTLYAIPFLVPSATTFVSIGVVTTGVALSSARLGIYNDSAGVPTTLVIDAGSVATTAGAFASIAISQLLGPGWYWLAAAVQGAAGNIQSTVNTGSILGIPTTAPFSGVNNGYSQTAISGALPSPWGATLTLAPIVPVVFMAPQ